jgi:hypothetical protein
MTTLEIFLVCVIALLVFTWALFRIPVINFTLAWVLGASWGRRSTSAQLWGLDQGLTVGRWDAGVAGVLLVRVLRVTVDYIAWAAGRRQENHCRISWEREALE